METKNITAALELLSAYMELNYEEISVADAVQESNTVSNAHAELAELQRLVSVVKEFVDFYDITRYADVDIAAYECNPGVCRVLHGIVDIVGYKG